MQHLILEDLKKWQASRHLNIQGTKTGGNLPESFKNTLSTPIKNSALVTYCKRH